MSISGAFNNALSGLRASSRQASTVSSNISNAQTIGYGRREVSLSATHYGSGGVHIDGITRVYNEKVLAARRLADSDLSFSQTTSKAITELYSDFGEVDDKSSLRGRLTALKQALISAQGDPSSSIRLHGVSDRMKDVARRVNEDASSIAAQRQNADQSIAQNIKTLNQSLAHLEKLNTTIQKSRLNGVDTSSLLDERQNIVDTISKIVPVKELPRQHGTIALISTKGQTLLDGSASQFSYKETANITAHDSRAQGQLSEITLNGEPLNIQNGYGNLAGGALEASFQLRDETLPKLQLKLDQIAKGLITAFGGQETDPSINVQNSNGYFVDPQNTQNDITGLSSRLSINSLIDPDQGGNPQKLRVGLYTSTSNGIGDTAQIERLKDAFSKVVSVSNNGKEQSITQHVIDFQAGLGADKLQADQQITFDANRRDTLRESELSDGVNTDAEMQRLLQIQQSYAANAKVIQIAQSMLQRLMEI